MSRPAPWLGLRAPGLGLRAGAGSGSLRARAAFAWARAARASDLYRGGGCAAHTARPALPRRARAPPHTARPSLSRLARAPPLAHNPDGAEMRVFAQLRRHNSHLAV